MSIQDYLIDHSGFDWPKLLSGWARLLPAKLVVWLMNRFGDLFLVYTDGSVHMLDVGVGTVNRIAQSRDDFGTQLDEGDNANQWLMIPLVDDLVAAGKVLKPGDCYGYVMPPILGGDYIVENTFVLSITEHYSFHAYLQEQSRICQTERQWNWCRSTFPSKTPEPRSELRV
jgi:hypothetical protein